MTKIKMLARLATPDLMVSPSQIVDVPDLMADRLIANGYALLVARIKAPLIVETGALDRQIETAAKPIKKKR